MSKRKQHYPEFEAKVALEALEGENKVSASARRFAVHLRPAGVCIQKRIGNDDPSMEACLA